MKSVAGGGRSTIMEGDGPKPLPMETLRAHPPPLRAHSIRPPPWPKTAHASFLEDISCPIFSRWMTTFLADRHPMLYQEPSEFAAKPHRNGAFGR